MPIDIKATFAKYMDDEADDSRYEYLEFKRVHEPLHPRPDICAFLLLDRLVPAPGRDIVSAAGHDEIHLDVDVEDLAKVATEEDILALVRCGVMYNDDYDSLFMFV